MKHSLRAIRTGVFGRNAAQKRVLVLGFLVVTTGALLGLRWMLGGNRSPTFQGDNSEGASSNVFLTQGFRPGAILNRRLVYPYSVIPGGVNSAEELRQIAGHDPVVAAHYSGFDYQNAQIVEVKAPRLVYLSYRRNDKIFWTHRQATLHPGEKLLTDGRTTARTRCGNQVSVLPQAKISPAEPMIAELDRPDAVASGIKQLFPRKLASTMFQMDPLEPLGPSSPGGPLIGSVWPGTFMPLPIGPSVGPVIASNHPPTNNPPTGNPPTGNPPTGNPPTGNPPTGNPPSGGPPITNPPTNNPPPIDNPPITNPPTDTPLPTAPEPGTVVLMVSGAIALIVRLRSMKR